MKRNSDINLFMEQFYKVIYVDFGINELNDNLKNWYKLSWDEFKKELMKFKIRTSSSIMEDWEQFFHHQKKKVLSVMK